MSDLPVYSPSETDDYLLCPRLRVLKRTWRPRGCGWRPHMALGNAIHAGIAAYYGTGGPRDRVNAHQVAEDTIAAEFREGSEWSLDGLRKLVTKGMQVALDTPLLSDDGTVVGAELWAAHSKID